MRYLNKVIFIESANIRYAELKLDGNVHLIGTQGVGKSTLLRALLFFYNANQQKLGIPIEKKRFVDFYYPYRNSFIIYEVMHESGPFTVMTYKLRGRVVFRFYNSVYESSHFIGQNDGQIAESWEEVRDNLGRHAIKYTRSVNRYEEYLDIIYGNNKGLGSEFRKYALLESKQYQNIPRAIQHVFLNYKVESDFIKDTIIKSLNDDEIPIDLSNYTHHLKDFETQLNDIKLWTEKPVKGENNIRRLADTIVETYSHVRFIEQDFRRLTAELASRLHQNEKLKTKFEGQLSQEKDKEEITVDSQQKSLKYYDNRKVELSGKRGVYVNKLKEAKLKNDEYEHRRIHDVLARVNKKDDWIQEQQNIINQKILLESNFNDVKQKYQTRIDQLNNQFESFRNGQQEKIQGLKDNFFQFKEALSSEYEQTIYDIKNQYEQKRLYAYKDVDDKKNELLKLRNRRFQVKNTRYHEEEIAKFSEKIQSNAEKIREAHGDIARFENDSDTLKKQWEMDRQRSEEAVEGEIINNKNAIQNVTVKIEETRGLVENSKDSLYGWLNKECLGWEETIGKVIDEERVLFNTDLTPEKTNLAPDSFYGIKINLDEIEKNVKTVSDYEGNIKEWENEIEELKKGIDDVNKRLVEQLDVFKRKYLPKIKRCKEGVVKCNYEISQYKISSDKASIDLTNWQRKSEEDQKNDLDDTNNRYDAITVEKLSAEKELALIEEKIDKRIKEKQKEKESKTKDKRIQNDLEQEAITRAIESRRKETGRAIRLLSEEQEKELEDKGADIRKIKAFQEQLNAIENELNFIEENTELAFNYRKDEKELFSKIEFFKTQRDLLDDKLNELETRQENQQQKQQAELDKIRSQIARLKQEMAEIEEDARQYSDFQQSYPYLDNIDRTLVDKPTERRGTAIIRELIANYHSRMKHINTLKESIHKFTGNFSELNIFKFKIRLIEESEFRKFAEELQEFIEEDKISEYEKRVNELFARIIQQVGNETAQLLSKENAIRRVINDINADFERKNFVGVIKSIELRMVPSSNKVVQLLAEIKQFNDDNIYNLGEVNLFTANQLSREENNKKAVQYLSLLSKAISGYRNSTISLSDSFELEFRVVENDNDTGWVDKLANVGSDGTDVLVKAMINIMLLNVFKEGATRNQFKEFRLHCMMDEIGKLHPNNVRGILKFANDRNIYLVNGSPQSFDALAYRYTYQLSKKSNTTVGKDITVIQRIVTNNRS